MDWVNFLKSSAELTPILDVDHVARDHGLNVYAVSHALRRLEARGLTERITKRTYLNRLTPDVHPGEIALTLRPESYISLESALRHWGISTQSPSATTCVTTQRPQIFDSESIHISFRRIKKDFFWGFTEKLTRYGHYRIAEPEKALLDFIYLSRQEGREVPWDELAISSLNKRTLLNYASQYPLTVYEDVRNEVLREVTAA
jgi:predicted transcriptional regulator of viral defense system